MIQRGEILLAEYSGDRFFFGYLEKIEYKEDGEVPIGYLSGECSFGGRKDAADKYIWCEFRRIVMKRGNVRLEAASKHMAETDSLEEVDGSSCGDDS